MLSGVAVLEPPFVLNDTLPSSQQVVFSGVAVECVLVCVELRGVLIVFVCSRSLLQAIVDRANRVYPDFASDPLQLNITTVEDGEYGTQYPNGTWSGAIGVMLAGQAAVGIGIFTVNSARLQSGLHFSLPFLSTGLGVLVRETEAPPDTWYFLVPFAAEVWVALVGCVAAACVSAWLLDRLSPYGYYRTSKDPEDRRAMNLTNMLYNGVMTLTRKTPTRGAKSVSTRVAVISMYFMAFFMINSYIAALTALIAVRETTTTISSWTDVRDRRIPFGVTAGSAAVDFFMSNSDPGIRGMAAHMIPYRNVQRGARDVHTGRLAAFIADTLTLEYEILQPPCNIRVVGPTIDTHFLAFTFNETVFDPPMMLKPIIDAGIVAAIDDNTISRLYANYFPTSGTCADVSTQQTAPKGLVPQQLAGVAYTFLITLAVSMCMLLFERLVYTQRSSRIVWWRKVNKALGLVYDTIPQAHD